MLDELESMESDVFEVLEAIKAYADQVGGELSKTVDSFYLDIQGRIKEIHYHHPKLRNKWVLRNLWIKGCLLQAAST